MSQAVFVLSTGRCSTQYLAKAVGEIARDAVVEHEGIGGRYVPRKIFRQPKAYVRTLERNPEIGQKLAEIEAVLAVGQRYVDTGWPVYAWIPYLQQRLGDRLEFIHLVRNPFEFAASLLTHRFFLTSNGRYKKQGVIFGADKGVRFKEVAAAWEQFSGYEKCLYHWLELNAFALECHSLPGFRGLFRFDQLYSEASGELQSALAILSGSEVTGAAVAPCDKVHTVLRDEVSLNNGALADAIFALAGALGFDAAKLVAEFDPAELQDRYASARLAVPLWPARQ